MDSQCYFNTGRMIAIMPDHEAIYKNEAEIYDALITKQPALQMLINEIRPYAGFDIVDVGAGTGRLTTVLAGDARSIVATDASQAMLGIAANKLAAAGHTNWRTIAADMRELPLEEKSADLIVAGWCICYLGSSNNPSWERDIEKVMRELGRVLRPGGTIIIFETMGTGFEQPNPPDFLLSYYSALTEKFGFSHKWIRLDYQFDSPEQAEQLTDFFFGEDMERADVLSDRAYVPECAGVWWLHT
ncbi:class I SAM-dependent methyltransferase [Paenibacillus harenae]|uniref:Ubiquinone/menaquinone biosynthesis C-methylase UbiE n=1 Tax=Paenibacillus harenae TaxID=306543 RepID=A0ABT9U650_PAEHA|nr:class I SAM-dependent methyltransferase [Paenibacillus harenae]MDQ0114732.1 ubiquinone/menaquinone biosynthesis C-methylase UbiE [Paenibacillus harenae]